RVTCFERVAEQRQRVSQLAVEAAAAPALPETQEEAGEDPCDERAGDERDEGAEAQRNDQADERPQAGDHEDPLRRLELDVGLLQIIRELAGMRRPRED